MIGVKFLAVAARLPPPQLAASAFQAIAPANRIATAAISMAMTLRMRLLPILSISAESFRRFCEKDDAVECRRIALTRPCLLAWAARAKDARKARRSDKHLISLIFSILVGGLGARRSWLSTIIRFVTAITEARKAIP